MSTPAKPISSHEQAISSSQRQVEEKERARAALSMAPVRRNRDLNLALERLKRAAEQSYQLMTVFGKRLLNVGTLEIAITKVYRDRNVPISEIPAMQQVMKEARADFFEDIETVIGQNVLKWLSRATDANRRTLTDLKGEMLTESAISDIHGSARRYRELLRHELQKLPSPPARTSKAGPPPSEIARREKELREAEIRSVKGTGDPLLAKLFLHPDRVGLFAQLAISPQEAAIALKRVFQDADTGLKDFYKEIENHQDHVWRYQPIVVGILAELGIGKDQLLMRFMVEFARLQSEKEDLFFLVAGNVIAFTGLAIVGGPLATFLLLLDASITGLQAYHIYQHEVENDLAIAASVLKEGRQFTDRPSNYGPFLLAVAASLLSATSLVIHIGAPKGSRQTVAEAKAAEITADARLAKGAVEVKGEQLKSDARAGAAGGDSPALQRGEQAGKIKEDERALSRSAERAPSPGAAQEMVPRQFTPEALARALKVLGIDLVPISERLKQAILVARGQIKVQKQRLDGILYVLEGQYYFWLDQFKDWTVQLKSMIDETAYSHLAPDPVGLAVALKLWRFAPVAARETRKLYPQLKNFFGSSISKLRDPEGKLFSIMQEEKYTQWDVMVEQAFFKHFLLKKNTRLLTILKEVNYGPRPDATFTLTTGGMRRLEVTSFWPDAFPKSGEALEFWTSKFHDRLVNKLVERGQMTTEFISPYGGVVPPGGTLCLGVLPRTGTARSVLEQAAQEAIKSLKQRGEVPDSVEILVGIVNTSRPDPIDIIHRSPAARVIE